jgi:hypothetical protein
MRSKSDIFVVMNPRQGQSEMTKSSRHQKITGDFAEMIVLYWLSKSGYECARIDHTGIDIIAAAQNGRLIGISVQGRSRAPGTENTSVNLHEFEKARVACRSFGCLPYSAIVVDRAGTITCYLLSFDHLENIAGGKSTRTWSMNDKFLKRCHDDPKIAHFELIGNANWREGSDVLKAACERAAMNG